MRSDRILRSPSSRKCSKNFNLVLKLFTFMSVFYRSELNLKNVKIVFTFLYLAVFESLIKLSSDIDFHI